MLLWEPIGCVGLGASAGGCLGVGNEELWCRSAEVEELEDLQVGPNFGNTSEIGSCLVNSASGKERKFIWEITSLYMV